MTFHKYIYIYIGNIIIPTDELIFFRRVAQPPTSEYMFNDKCIPGLQCEFIYYSFAPNIGGKNKRKKQDFYVFTRDTTPKSFGTT